MGRRPHLKPAEWKLIARVRELTRKQRGGRSQQVVVQKVGEKFEVGVYTPHGILDNNPMPYYFDDSFYEEE